MRGVHNKDIESFLYGYFPKILALDPDRVWRVLKMRMDSGETVPYLGRDVTLQVEQHDSPRVRTEVSKDDFRVYVPNGVPIEQRGPLVERALKNRYKALASEHVNEVVPSWIPVLGKGKGKLRVSITNTRHEWASCRRDGNLRFSWRVAMLPPPIVEYIVIHEMAHLTHFNHSREFWGLVNSVLPTAQQRRKELKQVGSLLPF